MTLKFLWKRFRIYVINKQIRYYIHKQGKLTDSQKERFIKELTMLKMDVPV